MKHFLQSFNSTNFPILKLHIQFDKSKELQKTFTQGEYEFNMKRKRKRKQTCERYKENK